MKVGDFLTEMKLAPKMIVIDSAIGLQAAFSTLVQNNILSAPVSEGGKFIGFLDIRDLVSFVLFASREHAKQKALSLDELMSKEGFFQPHPALMIEQTKMYDNPLQAITVSYLCRRNRFEAVTTQDKLIRVLELLSTKELHRVPVQDGEGRVVAVISQSNIIDFVSHILAKEPNALQQSIADLKLGHSPVYSALGTAPAALAFDLMDKKQVFGLAVVDAHGALVGNISASDIKLFLQSPHFGLLTEPCLEFLTAIRRRELRTRVPAAVVSPSAPLSSVVNKLSATRMHRLFVCDDAHRPTHVITHTDVLAALLAADRKSVV